MVGELSDTAISLTLIFLRRWISVYVIQAGLELKVLLPQPPECGGHRGT